jgi:type I restriction-modification system DNA methylase subunit
VSKISNPFESVHKTERTANQKLVEWINQITKEDNIPLGMAEQETSGADRKQPDVIIYKEPSSKEILCLMELKPPHFDSLNEEELIEPARKKATRRRASYFCTCNFQELIWFDTAKVNSLKTREEQIVQKYQLSSTSDLDLIDRPDIKSSIIRSLKAFLIDLYEVSSGKKAQPKHGIDEYLVFQLQAKIKALAVHYEYLIKEQTLNNPEFSKQLQRWFVDQNWSFSFQEQDFKKAARQAAYLLVNKILFYNVLQSKLPHELDPLEIPQSLAKGSRLKSTLQSYFDEVLKIDYETIYTADFIDAIAFPDILDVVEEVKELVNILNRYNFSNLGFDVIGRIFESLIPAEERHILGQYFTNSDIVDIILRFCLRNERDKVFDPGCGAGTFLVRAYQHKKLMNQRLTHEEILPTLWGNDIAKFPAHLSTINLAINDLAVTENYPRIIQKDFFELLPATVEFGLPKTHRQVEIKGLSRGEKIIEHPRWFDCVVGNPPYTRQEEIADISAADKEYKSRLIKEALQDLNGKKIATISKRAGIHAYFFVHGMKFLRNGGRFGFIVSNSWLDVDYGKGLQEFFLKNYKIVAIIESKVERWFADADVNTCIVILEKCSGYAREKERNENLARFVYLKKPLRYFIPPAQDMWEKQIKRLNETDKLIKTILAHNELYENEELRIFPKKQSELWEEGYDPDSRKYTGAKWGKYLRAPDIFFKILEKGKGKLVPLKKVAEVRRGFTTGADPWFYVKDVTDIIKTEELRGKTKREISSGIRCIESGDGSKWFIESRFVKPVLRNPTESKKILVSKKDLPYRVLYFDKPSNISKLSRRYIKHGESKPYAMGKGLVEIPSKTNTCLSRRYWFQLPSINPANIFWQKAIDISHKHYLTSEPALANQRFYPIYPFRSEDTELIWTFLNTTITALYLEFQRVGMGLGAIEATVYEVKQLNVIHPAIVPDHTRDKLTKLMSVISEREIGSIFEEIGAVQPSEVSLDKVKPDRRELDQIIMGNILGLTDEEQLEVYRAVIDLVKSRIEKAKSISKKNKTKEGIDIDALTKTVMDKVGPETLGKFYKEKILSQKTYTKKLPKKGKDIKIDQTLMSWQLSSGRDSIDCTSEEQARYLKIWLEAGFEEVKVPYNDDYLKLILPELESCFDKTKKVIDDYLYSIIDQKTRKKIEQKLWQGVTR